MTSIITRSGKGSALTHPEMDSNLDSLNGINESQIGKSYTVTAADQNRTIELSNAATVTVTLTLISTMLAASDTSNFKVILKNIGVGQVDIVPTTDTFDDGDTTKTINQFEWICIETDNAGTSWNVINLGFITGPGGGLDADTVDGSHASDLLDRANHTGTQATTTITGLTASAADINASVGDWHLIQTKTFSAGNPFVNFTTITTGFKKYRIEITKLTNNNTVGSTFAIVQFSSDNGATYDTTSANYVGSFTSFSMSSGVVTSGSSAFAGIPFSSQNLTTASEYSGSMMLDGFNTGISNTIVMANAVGVLSLNATIGLTNEFGQGYKLVNAGADWDAFRITTEDGTNLTGYTIKLLGLK